MPDDVVSTSSRSLKIMAIIGAGCSVIAIIPVPYLVARSVYYLETGEEDFTFNDMVHSHSPIFWIAAPLTSLLAVIAVLPFNLYNIYKLNHDALYHHQRFTVKNFAKLLLGILFLSSGSVNGYNTNYAINDMFGPREGVVRSILQVLCVAIATGVAGVGDARVVLAGLAEQVPGDYRYVRRGVSKINNRLGFFQAKKKLRTPARQRKNVLKSIRTQLDDLKQVILLAVPSNQLDENSRLITEPSWVNDINANEFDQFLTLVKVDFPVMRFVGANIVGVMLSVLLAYFGNKNVINYADKAFNEFFEFIGFSSDSTGIAILAGGFARLGYSIGFLLGAFLIRTLFFQDILKKTSINQPISNYAKIFLPLLPAFSFGLLNVILTVTNDTLSSFTKLLVSCSAIIGATVVSRYGIEGGVEEIMGKENIRLNLAGQIEKIMQHCVDLEYDELVALNEKLSSVPAINQDEDPTARLLSRNSR